MRPCSYDSDAVDLRSHSFGNARQGDLYTIVVEVKKRHIRDAVSIKIAHRAQIAQRIVGIYSSEGPIPFSQ
jgi:hypothetical protein